MGTLPKDHKSVAPITYDAKCGHCGVLLKKKPGICWQCQNYNAWINVITIIIYTLLIMIYVYHSIRIKKNYNRTWQLEKVNWGERLCNQFM